MFSLEDRGRQTHKPKKERGGCERGEWEECAETLHKGKSLKRHGSGSQSKYSEEGNIVLEFVGVCLFICWIYCWIYCVLLLLNRWWQWTGLDLSVRDTVCLSWRTNCVVRDTDRYTICIRYTIWKKLCICLRLHCTLEMCWSKAEGGKLIKYSHKKTGVPTCALQIILFLVFYR